MRVARLREQFVFANAPVKKGIAPLPYVGAVPSREPVIGAGALARVEVDGAGLRPIVRQEAMTGVKRAAKVGLPRLATGRIDVEADRADARISFKLLGTTEVPAALSDGLVVYGGALAGADVVHRVDAEGVEDYIAFDKKPELERVRYQVDVTRVAGLRLVGNSLEFLNAAGTPALRISPPYLVDSAGSRHDATLSVTGCAFDTNPAPPHRRAVTSPGAKTCEVDVSWTGVSYPALLDPTWATTGSLAVPRYSTTVKLPSGKLITAGGQYASGANNPTASTEVYDPGTHSWTTVDPLPAARAYNGLVALPNGKILAAGGSDTSTQRTEAWLYTEGATWASTGALGTARSLVQAAPLGISTGLAAGGALIAGGLDPSTGLVSAEVYNISTASFSLAANDMSANRYGGAAVVLASGKVLLLGGLDYRYSGVYPKTADLFDPATRTFGSAGSMNSGRQIPAATLLKSGKVLVVGGYSAAGTISSTAELYDPAGNSWAPTTNPTNGARTAPAIWSMTSGQVLLAGGGTSGSHSTLVELFDPAAQTFTAQTALTSGRGSMMYNALPDGTPVMISGQNASGTLVGTTTEYRLDAAGTTCSTAASCASGRCVEGVCCDTDCTGACESCKVTGKTGTCSAVPAGAPITGKTCGTGTCGGTCNGTATTCTYPTASTSCGTASCTTATLTPAGTCNGSGTCTAGTAAACTGSLICASATTCMTSCTSNSHCTGGKFCVGGACVVGKANGEACGANGECASAQCIEGVCCNTSCDKPCESCKVASKVGTCSPVPTGAPIAGKTCGSGTCGGSCGGASTCVYPPTGTACGAATSCASGMLTPGQTCDGLGVCSTVTSTACAGGVKCKDATSCGGACAADTDCQGYPSSYCSAGTCKGKLALGEKCDTKSQCTSDFCADGVCCNEKCDGTCETCLKTVGTCQPTTAERAPGCGGVGACKSTCDGTSRSCKSTDGTACSKEECKVNLHSKPGVCGSGACTGIDPVPCPNGLKCNSNGVECLTRCTSVADCMDTYYCSTSSGSCQPRKESGKGCADNTECTDNNCNDNKECGQGKTGDPCPNKGAGYVFDNTGKCVQGRAASTDSGGCSVTDTSQTGSTTSLLALVGVALAIARRRAQRSA